MSPAEDGALEALQKLQQSGSEAFIDEMYHLTHILAEETPSIAPIPSSQSYFAWISPAPLPVPELSNPETLRQISEMQEHLTQKQKDIQTLLARVKELEHLHTIAPPAPPVTSQSRSLESLQEENRVLIEAIDILEAKMAKMQVATPVAATAQSQEHVTMLDCDAAVAYEIISNLRKLAMDRVATLAPLPSPPKRPMDDILEAQRLYRYTSCVRSLMLLI